MDALHMTKDRLRNGGFERLKNAMTTDITGNSLEATKGFTFDLGNPSEANMVKEMFKNILDRTAILNKRPTLNKHQGVLNGEYGWPNIIPEEYKRIGIHGLWKGAKGKAHEFVHSFYQPLTRPKGFDPMVSKDFNILKYFHNNGSLELNARGTQLKNYFGLKEGEQLTPEMWNYAARHYATDVADNNMTEFFLSGSNKYPYHPFFLQWLNKHAPAVGTGITVTGETAKTINNNE